MNALKTTVGMGRMTEAEEAVDDFARSAAKVMFMLVKDLPVVPDHFYRPDGDDWAFLSASIGRLPSHEEREAFARIYAQRLRELVKARG